MSINEKRAERLTATLASLGPTFIKLAQLLSARADIFPEPYLTAIGHLQDQVPADPTDDIIRVLEKELGTPLGDVFQEFDREPVAAASLGQVHRARIGGEEVVVKVLRPGVEEVVALDLDISFRILFWLNVFVPQPSRAGAYRRRAGVLAQGQGGDGFPDGGRQHAPLP